MIKVVTICHGIIPVIVKTAVQSITRKANKIKYCLAAVNFLYFLKVCALAPP